MLTLHEDGVQAQEEAAYWTPRPWTSVGGEGHSLEPCAPKGGAEETKQILNTSAK